MKILEPFFMHYFDVFILHEKLKLDNYLNDAIGEEKQQKKYNQHNALVDIDDVILLIDGKKLIGCGGIKK